MHLATLRCISEGSSDGACGAGRWVGPRDREVLTVQEGQEVHPTQSV